MQVRSKAYLQMHVATFLWGVTAILGKLISVSEFPLVWYRVFFVSACMVFFPGIVASLRQIPKKSLAIMGGIGVLLALHWVLWYASIKYANASVAVSCIAGVSLFIALLEPLITRKRFDRSNLFFGLLVIPGILMINQSLDLHYKFGFMLGIAAALLAAIFSILNKEYTEAFDPRTITFVQMASGWLFLCLCLPVYEWLQPGKFHLPGLQDVGLLLMLAIVCTIIPYILFLHALKASDAFTTSLINNLEPVYGIILAAIFLQENEELNWKFYTGTGIILFAVLLHAAVSQYKKRKQ